MRITVPNMTCNALAIMQGGHVIISGKNQIMILDIRSLDWRLFKWSKYRRFIKIQWQNFTVTLFVAQY